MLAPNQTWTIQLEQVPRVWMLFEAIDGTWILIPLAAIGAVLNAFLLWILRKKANLHSAINASISAECIARLAFCAILFPFKAWLLTISPMLRLSLLPSPKECFAAAALSYLSSIVLVAFNLLTNLLRYLYIKAGNAQNRQAVKISTLPKLKSKLVAILVVLIGIHVGLTDMAENDQFIFDQGCLRPHGNVKAIRAPTKYLFHLLLVYLIPSTFMSMLILRFIMAEKKRLDRSLQIQPRQQMRPNMNLYTAGTGIAQVAVIVLFMLLLNVPVMAARFFQVEITTSLESFIVEFSTVMVNGVITPSIIFWSSSETRGPALKLIRQAWSTILRTQPQ